MDEGVLMCIGRPGAGLQGVSTSGLPNRGFLPHPTPFFLVVFFNTLQHHNVGSVRTSTMLFPKNKLSNFVFYAQAKAMTNIRKLLTY